MDDISIPDEVIFPLRMEKTFLSRYVLRTTGDEIRKRNDLRANKPPFHICVDLPRGLGGWRAA
jgi:hypothetical protein